MVPSPWLVAQRPGSCEREQRHAPGDDEEGDGDGLGGEGEEHGAQDIVGQQGDGPGQNLPGHGVVHERTAGLGAADPEDTGRGGGGKSVGL